MKTTVALHYPASPEAVIAMLGTQEYQLQRARAAGLPDARVEVASHDDACTARISGTVRSQDLPPAAARFLRSDLSFTVTESWSVTETNGLHHGTLHTQIQGAPVTVGGRSTLRPSRTVQTEESRAGQTDAHAPNADTGSSDCSEQGSEMRIDLEISIAVPLLGRTLEQRAVGMMEALVRDEEARAATWLSTH